MNIRIVQDGKQVEQGRDLRALIERFGDAGQVQMLTLSDDRYQRSDIQKWDFGSLPTATETKINGLPVRAFPCLKATKSGVELTVEADSDAALQSHREGVLHLLRQSLSPQERDIKQLIQKSMKPHWLLAKGLGSESELVNDLLSAVFAHILLPQSEPLPRNEDEFNQRLDRRGELWAHAETLMGLFVEWLKIRHQILKHMRGAVSLDKAMAFSDAKAHLERLLERGFMLKADWPRLKSYSRYLKGIEYRLDKLQGNLPRDRQSMIEFESIYTPWRDLTEKNDAALRSTLVEFGWLLEELRISLFAQPLGTQEPVSLKRLQKRWADIVQGG
jgi:ATP-dependent helicase HrpA